MSEASERLLEMTIKRVNVLAFFVKVQVIIIILLEFFMWRLETRVNSMHNKVDTLTLCNGKIIP